MADTIRIALTDVKFYARIGVFEQERIVGNEFAINLQIEVPVTPGMIEDQLDGTISYADLYQEVADVMQRPAMTLEFVALSIAKRLRNRWPEIVKGCISVVKVAPPIAGMNGSANVTYSF